MKINKMLRYVHVRKCTTTENRQIVSILLSPFFFQLLPPCKAVATQYIGRKKGAHTHTLHTILLRAL